MPIDLNLLKQEIISDPLNLGYAPFLSIRNDLEVLNLINSVQPNLLVDRGRITKDEFIEITSQMVFGLMLQNKNGNTDAQFWLDVFDRLVANSDTINCQDPALDAILSEMLSANFITSQDILIIKSKSGSRAQNLFGQNVSLNEVSDSLNEGAQ